MADGEYVERVTLRIRGFDLDDVINTCTEKASVPTKPVNTMNKERAVRGFKQGNRAFGLELDAERIVDPRVPDWYDMLESGERFGIVVAPNVGKSISYLSCVVTDVTAAASDGDSSVKVSIMARRRKQ